MEQMDEEPEEVSEWRRVKESLAVNKPLIPLKATMLLIYGGENDYVLTLLCKVLGLRFLCTYSIITLLAILDSSHGTNRPQHRRDRWDLCRFAIHHVPRTAIGR